LFSGTRSPFLPNMLEVLFVSSSFSPWEQGGLDAGTSDTPLLRFPFSGRRSFLLEPKERSVFSNLLPGIDPPPFLPFFSRKYVTHPYRFFLGKLAPFLKATFLPPPTGKEGPPFPPPIGSRKGKVFLFFAAPPFFSRDISYSSFFSPQSTRLPLPVGQTVFPSLKYKEHSFFFTKRGEFNPFQLSEGFPSFFFWGNAKKGGPSSFFLGGRFLPRSLVPFGHSFCGAFAPPLPFEMKGSFSFLP